MKRIRGRPATRERCPQSGSRRDKHAVAIRDIVAVSAKFVGKRDQILRNVNLDTIRPVRLITVRWTDLSACPRENLHLIEEKDEKYGRKSSHLVEEGATHPEPVCWVPGIPVSKRSRV